MRHPNNTLGELYMLVRDHKKLASVMLVQGVSHRDLAEVLGWKSHSYIGRLCRGEIKSLDQDAALRIAHHLGMPVDLLFVTKLSEVNGSDVRSKRKNSAA